ncbi:MAG: preprotein translocase subunit SecG [Candidatus Gastranaerophilaceae bacterium]|jgi:preprotein translocase subunit SecG|nr:preprotein translocase subunit SecG [Christensenellales bacterium]
MDTLNIILNIVLIICSGVLVLSVLLQSTKSAGLGGAFGGDTQSFTARGRAASKEMKLQKLTIAMGIVIAVIAIAMMIVSTITKGSNNSEAMNIISNIMPM